MEEMKATRMAIQETDNPDPDPDLSMITPEYCEFADLFSKKEAVKLPVHRSYDHTISLESRKVLPFGLIYILSLTELEVVWKYITKNLRKGFICHCQSPCGASIIFTKKVDGVLQLCIDYGMELEVGILEQLQDRDLEQAIHEQDWLTSQK